MCRSTAATHSCPCGSRATTRAVLPDRPRESARSLRAGRRVRRARRAIGSVVDDDGTEYEITDTLWSHGRNARYRIVEWSPSGMYLLARNHADNPSEPGRWTRIDWVELDGSEYGWGYCYVVYDAASPDEARRAAPADRDHPRTGCNGHPFTRMKPIGPPEGWGRAPGLLSRRNAIPHDGVR